MNILYTILIGLLVLIIAKLLVLGQNPTGFIISSLLGIGGTMLAKFPERPELFEPGAAA